MKIRSKRRVGIRERDCVIGIAGTEEQSRFEWAGTVASAEFKQAGSEPTQVLHLTFSSVTVFEEPRELSVLAASLHKVNHYASPYKHFRNEYVSIGAMDYTTIVGGDVFLARTAVGAFLSALPGPTIGRFLRQLAAHDPGFVTGGMPMETVWQHLTEFLIGELVVPANLLEGTLRALDELNSRQAHLARDGKVQSIPVDALSVETERGEGVLRTQELALSDFVASLSWGEAGKEENLLTGIRSAIMEDASTQQNFENKFKGKPWPVSRIRL